MFKRGSFSEQIASDMEDNLITTSYEDDNRKDIKRIEALNLLVEASESFDNAGLMTEAEVVAQLMEIIAKKRKPTAMEKEVWKHFGNISYAQDGVGKTPEGEEYHPIHEGPGEAQREDAEEEAEEELEDKFLNMILGEEPAEIVEDNEADDINMIDSLFEDV
jgi:hypothetical protein